MSRGRVPVGSTGHPSAGECEEGALRERRDEGSLTESHVDTAIAPAPAAMLSGVFF
jgi:hypothetical protein